MKKDDILHAALEEFGKYDYERASINSIIEKSNTSKGTFYHYFNSKETLYLELLKIVAKEKVHFLQENINDTKQLNDDSSIFEILKDQIEASMKFALAYPKYANYATKVAHETNLEMKEKIESIIGNVTNDFYDQLIQDNIKQGYIRNDFPKEFISHLFMYMMTHFNEFILKMGVKLDSNHTSQIMDYLNYYFDFIENGMRPKNNKE